MPGVWATRLPLGFGCVSIARGCEKEACGAGVAGPRASVSPGPRSTTQAHAVDPGRVQNQRRRQGLQDHRRLNGETGGDTLRRLRAPPAHHGPPLLRVRWIPLAMEGGQASS